MTIIIDNNIDLSGRRLPKIISPFPPLGGALFSAHLTGARWDGEAGAGDDWSGNRRNLIVAGVTVEDDRVTGVSAADYLATPFSTDDMLAAGAAEVTIIGAFNNPTGAPVTPLFNSGGAAPYIALHAVPSGNRVQAYAFGSDGTNANTNVFYTSDVSEIEDHWAVFGCRWSPTALQPFYFRPSTGALISATTLTHTKGLSGSGAFKSLHAAAPNGSEAAAAYYTGWLDDADVTSVYLAMKAKLAEAGITV